MTGRARLAVVGSLNVDVVATAPRLPAPGETIGDGVLRREPGGKGANQAAAAARLGAVTRMFGCVGRDADGDLLVGALGAAGVDVAGIGRADAATGTAIIMVDAAGENSIVVCPGANAAVDSDAIGIGGDEAVLMQLEVPLEVVRRVATSAPGFVALNAAPARSIPTDLVERVDLFVVNETEYGLIPELAGARRVVVTLGADGAELRERGEVVARAAGIPPAAVRSTVGAGDAFAAALVVALLEGDEPAAALGVACRVGSAAVEHLAAQPPFDRLDHYRSHA
ncbi:PfkB family carbohydrate kinase [Agromyces kandeliae]|uniref:Ribokinase n=1 Tax=Agromyces kandeliae TaxID=2666141 RepID=A0A6L5R3Z8_9MICO|nr:PfkB family carbohydrate kinase [Agromyces kandeliae]MRX44801.1 ribokinase [Agromyces kandeliae]